MHAEGRDPAAFGLEVATGHWHTADEAQAEAAQPVPHLRDKKPGGVEVGVEEDLAPESPSVYRVQRERRVPGAFACPPVIERSSTFRKRARRWTTSGAFWKGAGPAWRTW